MNYLDIESKISNGTAIDRADARWLFAEATSEQLSTLATLSKSRYHKAEEASYLIMAIINYTNVCVAKCDYCSFYRLPHQKGTYLLDFDQICERIESLRAMGGSLVGFNGGFHPGLRLDDYAQLFEKIHRQYPTLCFFDMTIAEFMFSCKISRLSYSQGANILKDAGTQWITGGGAEILDDSFRDRHSPGKFRVGDYFDAQRAVLEAGLGSTATMVIGFDETLEERFNHLEALRDFQNLCQKKLASFLCWTYKPWNNELGGEEIGDDEYLRWIAISRIFLHNFEHIRTSVLTRNANGLKALKFGANDFDLPTEDEVTQKAGATISLNFEGLIQSCQDMGFTVTCRKPFVLTGSDGSLR